MSTCTTEGELENYYKVVIDLVLKAGQVFRDGYNEVQIDFKTKKDFYDLVTVYDKQIEDLLIEGIKEKFPNNKFIGEEESAASKREAQLTDDPTWIIDPIDGTTNFIRKIPHCCISIGLSIKKELVLGIVYNPILNELFSAWKGHGAYLNGEKIRVSSRKAINESVIAYEIALIHDKRLRDKNVKRIFKLASNASGTRCYGGAALTLCYIAKGIIDVYHVEDMQAWDIAAGAVILREAGGVIVNSDGSEFNVMKPNLTATSTPELLKDIMGLIKEANEITSYTIEINDSVIAYEISLVHAKSVRDKNIKRLSKLASNATATRCFGSAAITLCYVAKGVIDAYHVDDLQPWDIAAGAVIIREAGGVILNSDGTEFNIMKPNLTAASTHELLKDVAGLIEQANAITTYTFE